MVVHVFVLVFVLPVLILRAQDVRVVRDAKVGDLDGAVGRVEEVGGFDIAVNDALPVDCENMSAVQG